MHMHSSERESYVPGRRNALRAMGIGSVALATVPIAMLSSATDVHADAGLVRLGEEFDRLRASWLTLWRESCQASGRCREILEGLNLPLSIEAYHEACRDSGLEAADDQSCAVLDVMRAVGDQIRATPATTFDGLHVKARVVLHESFNPSSLDGVTDIDMDWDALCYVEFMREIAALAGEIRV